MASSKDTGWPSSELDRGQSWEGPVIVGRPASQRGQGVPTWQGAAVLAPCVNPSPLPPPTP